MRKNCLFVMMILVTLLTASCNLFSPGGTSELEPKSKNLVRVSFSEDKTRSLNAEYKGYDITYYLTATPNFTRGDHAIVGAVTNQTLTDLNGGYYDAGYFEQGSWVFKLDAYMTEDGAKGTLLATQTLPPTVISAEHNVITFKLKDVEQNTGTGSVSFEILVPCISEKGENNYGVVLRAYVDYVDEQSTYQTFAVNSTATDLSNTDLLKFVGTLTDIPSGNRRIKFEYINGDKVVSSQVVEVRMVKDSQAFISGSMLNGAYVQGHIEIVYLTEAWNLAFAAGSENIEAVSGTDISITCTAQNVQDATSGPTYQWYKEGILIPSATSSTCKFKAGGPGIYSLTCVATVDGVSKSLSTYVYVKE